VTAPSQTEGSGKVVIRNIGLMLSGSIRKPILEADTVVIEAGRITAVGRECDCDTERADKRIDARGTTVAPGLIDSHVHPVAGDSTLNGAVTTLISAGEVHFPGRPRDILGVKALAITAQRSFANFRPAGVKVLAGAPVLEKGMVESDFAELAAAGVRLLGEVGLGSVKSGEEAQRMVAWARKYGIQSTIHTGGPSIPGSGLIDKDVVLEADADIIGHINGGHTSLPYADVCELCERSTRAIEIVHNGNERIGILTARHARELKCSDRVILGTDSPAGSGVQPLGILRLIALLSSMADIPAEEVFCYATGNTARLRGLDSGEIAVGRAADLVFLDRAQHTAGRDLLESVQLGDIPGVGMVLVDGVARCMRSRNTPPATQVPLILA
jgi:enamidase